MMRAGDVLFIRGTSPVSVLIRWLTKSPYTHVALALGDGRIIEADRFIRTRIRKLTDADVFDVHRLQDVDRETLNLVCMVARSYEGLRYDYLQVLGQLLRLAFGWQEPLFNRKNRFICSELIDVSFMASGVPRLHRDHVGNLSPGELLSAYQLRKVTATAVSDPIQVIQ
jgi:cell wall-associated NlpC family hydrolase